ncbi:MAG TPA: BtrH N-terminal domain-containing protein [Steroidobacteraceae bacterium]|nr:BtrH N-terminal domain-containing protein [Steroidobacteraceae bacterium]
MPRVEVPHFQPFVGQHCETVATGTLLAAGGLKLSEPMLFGLGEGLGFIFIKLSSLPLPFVGGRTKPFAVTEAICRNLGLACTLVETSSKAKAWSALEAPLRAGQPVGLQLDCFHLEYFSRPVHFAGHFVAAHGFDDREVMLVDTAPQGSLQKTSRASLEKARFAKGPMAAKARAWTIAAPARKSGSDAAVAKALRTAIRANAKNYLSPPFKGASHLGIVKLADSLPRWLEIAGRPADDLALAALLMEKAGTGGSLFRNFYRDFLFEAREVLAGARATLIQAQTLFANSAHEWAAIAASIERSGRSGEAAPLGDAAQRCRRVADIEVTAMRLLEGI